MSSSTRRHTLPSPWSPSRLQSHRSFLLTSSIAPASRLTYSSALRSYRLFCSIHAIPEDPTPDTLSLFLTFKSPTVKPQTLSTYLSAICSELETFYPSIREARRSLIVRKTLAGAF